MLARNDNIYFETKRLVIRRFEQQDLETFIAYRNDPDVARYQSWKIPFTIEDARNFFLEYTNLQLGTKGKWHQLAIELKESSTHIGDCALHTSLDGKQAEFGITIAREYQRKGLAFEALQALFLELFEKLKYHRITSLVDSENKSSLTLMEKLGMRKEAYFKESFYNGFNWTDEVQFALLEKEFLKK